MHTVKVNLHTNTHTHTRSSLGHHAICTSTATRRGEDLEGAVGRGHRAAGPCVEWTRVEGGAGTRDRTRRREARRGARTAHNSSVGEARSSGTKHLREKQSRTKLPKSCATFGPSEKNGGRHTSSHGPRGTTGRAGRRPSDAAATVSAWPSCNGVGNSVGATMRDARIYAQAHWQLKWR